jgi:hypothetical protein
MVAVGADFTPILEPRLAVAATLAKVLGRT